MSFGRNAAAEYDVGFRANTGQFRADMSVIEREYKRTTGGMSNEALRAAVAQEKLDRAIKQHGPSSLAAKRATLDYRREMQALSTTSVQAGRNLNHTEHELERFSRGALTGTGALHGLSRAAAFTSTAFLGGAGLVYGLRKVVEAGQEQGRILANLRNAVTDAGYSWSGYRGQIEAATEATKRHSAFDDDELYKSLQTLIRTTGDVNKALALNAKVTDIARGSGHGLQQVAAAVAKAYDGQTGALRRLVPTIQAGVKGQQAITQAARAYAGAAETYTKTAIGAQTSLTVAIGDTEKAIGRQLLPTVKQYELRLTDWLENTSNQKRLQRDVNEALHAGTKIVHGLAAAEKLLAPPIHQAIDAMGGLEHAAEAAFILALALKARKAAGAIGLITTASSRARTAIVADAAIEERALAGVTTAGSRASTRLSGAGAAALAKRGGGSQGGLLAALLLSNQLPQNGPTKNAEGALTFALLGSLLGPKAKIGAAGAYELAALYKKIYGKPLPGDFIKGVGLIPTASKETGDNRPVGSEPFDGTFAHYNIPLGDPGNAAAAAAAARGPARLRIPGGFTGSYTQAGYLTRSQQLKKALEDNPNNLDALRAKLAHDKRAIAFLDKRFAVGSLNAADYFDKREPLIADRDAQQGTISSIEAAAAAKTRAAAAKLRAAHRAAAAKERAAQRAADDARHTALRKELAGVDELSFTVAPTIESRRLALQQHLSRTAVGGTYGYDEFGAQERHLRNAALRAQLVVDPAARLAAEQKVERALIALYKAEEKTYGTAKQHAAARRKELEERLVLSKLAPKASARGNGAQFYSEAANEVTLYGSNIGPDGTILSGQDARGAAGAGALLGKLDDLNHTVKRLEAQLHHQHRENVVHARTTATSTKAIANARPQPIDDARLAAHYGY